MGVLVTAAGAGAAASGAGLCVTPGTALASAIVKGLLDGVEDIYPGDVAQEWLARWRDNPKVLERELAAGGM